MDPLAPPERTQRQLIELARRDRSAAERALAALPLDEQLALVCDAPLAERARLLDLLPAPEAIVPALPTAELCFTVKAIGLADAAWMLELATPEQVVAALDLDAWRGNALDVAAANEWLQALARTSPEARVRSVLALDTELLVLALRGRIGAVQRPDDAEGWSPPDGSQTLEGQFHYWAISDDDDLSDVTDLLRPLFESAYWVYFRLMLALQWELDSDTEEWALRWRSGRLEDLGFPSWDEAMRIYRFLAPERRRELPPDERPLDVAAWELPVWLPRLPEARGEGQRLFRAIASLDEDERRAIFFAFVGLANRVAVADRLPLGDAESTPRAIEKAAVLASAGLAELASAHGRGDVELLRRVSLERLFRIGANLDPERARR